MGEQPNQRRWNNEKDTLSAESIVLRTEAAALALGWNDEATFNNFSLSLRAAAEKWLQMTKEIREDFRPQWSFIKPYFRATYGTKVDESKVLQIFAEMKQKPNEDPNNYAINFNENWRVIKEQFKLRRHATPTLLGRYGQKPDAKSNPKGRPHLRRSLGSSHQELRPDA